MAKIRIDKKTGFAYIPKEIREDGWVGDLDYQPNAYTLTLIKPGTSLEQLEHSVEILLDDTRLKLGKSKLREVLKE